MELSASELRHIRTNASRTLRHLIHLRALVMIDIFHIQIQIVLIIHSHHIIHIHLVLYFIHRIDVLLVISIHLLWVLILLILELLLLHAAHLGTPLSFSLCRFNSGQLFLLNKLVYFVSQCE